MKLWISILLGVLILGGIVAFDYFTTKPIENVDVIEEETPQVQDISSTQITWNGNPLLDSTTYDAGTNKCYAERNNMKIEVYPCVAQDVDGKNIEQKVNFTWKGGTSQNVGWIFVYDGDLISGKVEADKEVKRQLEQTRYSNDWINNYLVSGVSNYTDLGTPDARCQNGNANNTMMYLVTQYGEKKVYCFSSRTVINSTAFRISGNYDKPENYFVNITGITKVDVTDRFQKISSPLNDAKSYYKVDEVTFNPSQSIYTHWTYTPKDASKSGKWHILGYDADIGLVQSITQNRYIYLDPWWNGAWSKKKAIAVTSTDAMAYSNVSVFINVTFDSDMQTDFDDLRFLDAEEDNELGYWFMNNTYVASGNVYVYVKLNRNLSSSANTTIYMYYGNPSASTTNNIVSAFLFGDDFNGSSIDFPTRWWSLTTSCYSLNGTGYLIGNLCGNRINTNMSFSQGYEAVIRMQSNSTAGVGGMYLHSVATTTYQVLNTYNGNAVGYLGGEPQYTGNPINANQFYLLRYKNNASGKDAITFSNDSYNIAVGDKLSREEAGNVRSGQIGMYQYSTGAFTADWVFVKRAVSTEPTVTFGGEESSSGAPTIVFESIYPNNISTTSLGDVNVIIRYNVSGSGIDTAQTNLFWLTNGSYNVNNSWFVNGSRYHIGFTSDGVRKSNVSDTWNFTLGDNIYPGTYLLNLTLFEDAPHLQINLTSDNDAIKATVFNMTNTTSYNFLEFMIDNRTATTASLRVYYCNSSYSTGNFGTTTNCGLAANVLASDNNKHTENQSTHTTVPISINTTTGTLAGVRVTPTGYFVWRGRTEGWSAYYVSTIARSDATQLSANTGIGWANVLGTLDTHLHQFSPDTAFNYYACSNLTASGTYNCSTIRTMSFNITNLPPSPPIVNLPANTTYNISIPINYSAAISPGGLNITHYNISLHNADDSFNRTIIGNTTSLNYTFNNTNIVLGQFNVHVRAYDTLGQTATGESELFMIYNPTNTTTTVSTSPASPITYGISSTFDCTNNGGLGTQMYINGVNKTNEKNVSLIRGAGSYTINCSALTSEDGVLIGSSQEVSYTINQAIPVLTLSASPSNVVNYGTETTVTGSGCPSQLSCTFRENNVVVANPRIATLNAGNYTYNYTTSGNTNYTTYNANLTLIVNKVNPSLSISLSPSSIVTNGTSTTATGLGCPDSSCLLKRDGTLVSNPETTTLAVGNYLYNYSYTGSPNYNVFSVTSTLSVNPVTFAGTNGSMNFSSNNISQTMQFQVPYRFVTRAMMNLTGFNITNLNVTQGNNQIIYYSGALVGTQNTGNFYIITNQYLTSCTYIGSYCIVPITFTSNTTGTLNYSDVVFISDGFIEGNLSYNLSVYETALETFVMNNLQYDDNAYTNIEVDFIYQNKSYLATKSCSGMYCNLSKSLDIPTVSGNNNNTFLWQIALTNQTSTYYFNTTPVNINVSNLFFNNCSSGNVTVNFTVYNAKDITSKVNSTFDSTFQFWLGTGSVKENSSFEDNVADTSSFKFCINPSVQTYRVSGDIAIGATSFANNYHYYNNATFNNVTLEQKLYLLNASLATATEINVLNDLQNGLVGYYVQLQQYDVGTGTYFLYGMAKTNYNGEDNVYLNWYDTLYKPIVIDTFGNIVANLDPYKVFATPQVFRISEGNPFSYRKFANIEYTLYYNNVTGNVVATFLDPAGEITSGCLLVMLQNYTTLYDTCIDSTSGTLSYSLAGANNNTYAAVFYIKGSFNNQATLWIVLGEIRNEILRNIDVKDRGFYAFIIIGLAAMIGLFSPSIAIFFGALGFVAASALGFINLTGATLVSFIGIFVLVMYVMWKMRS